MDPRRIDLLARSVVTPKSRRGFFGGLAALAAGLVGFRGTTAEVSQAFSGNKTCKNNPGKCNDGCVCCVYGNGNSRCGPPSKCGTGGTITCAPGLTFCPSIGSCAECCDRDDCGNLEFCLGNVCVPSGCFVAGTRIAMADGSSRPIELLEPGDPVLGRDGRVNSVIRVARPQLGQRQLYSLNGSDPFVTASHPFATEMGWKAIDLVATMVEHPGLAVGRLAVGDRLLSLAMVAVPALVGGGGDEPVEVRVEPVALRSLTGQAAAPDTQLYNPVLDGDHTYFADDLLIHNKT